MAGFTTVRDVGSRDFLDVGLRDAIDAGIVAGPRMLVSVKSLGSTGGHCDGGDGFRFGALNHETGPRDGVINSADEARYAVRFNIKYGGVVYKNVGEPVNWRRRCTRAWRILFSRTAAPLSDRFRQRAAQGYNWPAVSLPPVRAR